MYSGLELCFKIDKQSARNLRKFGNLEICKKIYILLLSIKIRFDKKFLVHKIKFIHISVYHCLLLLLNIYYYLILFIFNILITTNVKVSAIWYNTHRIMDCRTFRKISGRLWIFIFANVTWVTTIYVYLYIQESNQSQIK